VKVKGGGLLSECRVRSRARGPRRATRRINSVRVDAIPVGLSVGAFVNLFSVLPLRLRGLREIFSAAF
jgi:hypothetical protein